MKFDRKAPKYGIVAFFLALVVFIAGHKLVDGIVKKAQETPVFNGGTSSQTENKGEEKDPEVVEKLSHSMTPIVVDPTSPFYTVFQKSDRVNVLLLGVNEGMTDTIMVGSYNMDAQTVDIISVPRDTYYYRKGYGANTAFQKINAIYHTDGIGPLAEAVSSLLYGMPLHYYAIVEYQDIRKVMDVVGGIQVEIPFHMKYQDTTPGYELYIDIPAGLQTIDSSNVIEFLRFRHTNPFYAAQGYKSYDDQDLQRIQAQQNFVKLFIGKCLKLNNLLDVVKFALNEVESDIDYAMAVKVATKAMKGLNADSIKSYTVPGTGFFNELWFMQNDAVGTYELLEVVFGLKTPDGEVIPEDKEEPDTTVVIEPGSRIRLVEVPSYE
jgi:LCP family protein required for cell wall assembly